MTFSSRDLREWFYFINHEETNYHKGKHKKFCRKNSNKGKFFERFEIVGDEIGYWAEKKGDPPTSINIRGEKVADKTCLT